MIRKLIEKHSKIILICIILLGFMLRSYNYTVWPRDGATFDEYAWTFLGVSLWEKGIPTSWSPHDEYTHKVQYYNPQGAHFTLVTPYLEHPPLFGLVAGGFAMLNGVRSFNDVTIAKMRPLALVLGVLAILGVYLLTSSMYGNPIGLLASFLYAIVPTVVIGSRIVQNENFFIPFFLLALYFTDRYLKRPTGTLLTAISLICGLLPLAKVPWMAAPLAVIGIFLFSKKWKEAITVGVVTVLCFSSFIIYGLVLDKTLFLNLWKLQLARYDLTFDSLFIMFRDPIVVDRALVDGWIYFGWVAITLLMIKDIKKNVAVVMGFLAYGALYIFAIPSEPLHGWYRYPFYPFLIIATAVFLVDYFNKDYFVSALFYLVTGLSMFAESWGRVLGFSYPVFRTYLVTVGLGALSGVFPSIKYSRILKLLNILVLFVILLLSVWTIIVYTEQ
ncbi:MAG TPA: glycosyltransferase family 39 protein [Patescibacteria group bacterium]|nr:glycosyltransferase family 39 protein [Patescibacteria group bacterium]